MTIDPTTLPDPCVVEYVVPECGCSTAVGVHSAARSFDEITRVFVPVPEGMTYADTEAALADAGAWVEVEGITDAVPQGSRIHMEWVRGDSSTSRYYVHRDDLPPADPDADLVEKMARAAHAATALHSVKWEDRDEFVREEYRGEARAALAVVREHEARS